jgi:hypothetical protein
VIVIKSQLLSAGAVEIFAVVMVAGIDDSKHTKEKCPILKGRAFFFCIIQ